MPKKVVSMDKSVRPIQSLYKNGLDLIHQGRFQKASHFMEHWVQKLSKRLLHWNPAVFKFFTQLDFQCRLSAKVLT